MAARTFSLREHEAVAAASEWRLIALLLERPRANWHDEVHALAREVQSSTLRGASRVARDADEGSYLRVFGSGGAVSPREVTYRGMEDPGRLLSNLAGFYEAFAYRPRAEDPIDHVSVEAGFVGYLRLKEAFASSRGDEESADVAAAGAKRFVEEHVRYWAGPLVAGLVRAGAPHLVLAARSALDRAGPVPVRPAGPWTIAPRDSQDDDASCGCGDDLVHGEKEPDPFAGA
ncbi:MAG: molecular chaperone TorD family protein [bacterium]